MNTVKPLLAASKDGHGANVTKIETRTRSRQPHEIADDECLFCGLPYDATESPICPNCGPSFEHEALEGAR